MRVQQNFEKASKRLQLTIFIIESRGSSPLAPFYRVCSALAPYPGYLLYYPPMYLQPSANVLREFRFLNCLGLQKNVKLQSTDRYINKDYDLASVTV